MHVASSLMACRSAPQPARAGRLAAALQERGGFLEALLAAPGAAAGAGNRAAVCLLQPESLRAETTGVRDLRASRSCMGRDALPPPAAARAASGEHRSWEPCDHISRDALTTVVATAGCAGANGAARAGSSAGVADPGGAASPQPVSAWRRLPPPPWHLVSHDRPHGAAAPHLATHPQPLQHPRA